MKILSYIITIIILSLLFLIIKGMKNSKIIFEKPTNLSSKKKRFLIKFICTLSFAIGSVFVFFSTWFISYFGELTPEQFLFNLKSPITGTSSGMTEAILTNPVFNIVLSTSIFLLLINFKYNIFINIKDVKKKVFSQKIFKRIYILISILVLTVGVTFGVKKLRLNEVVRAYFSSSNYIEETYKDPRDVNMTFPKKKRNLIHIYLESIENSYLSKELGGHMNENLMPELTELSKEGIHFSHNDKFGGPSQTYGSSWSVASMINMGAGIPLKVPMDRNTYGKTGSFLPGAITIGDILEAQGYNQTIMFGADADFGGLTTYFNTHGNFNIFDVKAARAKKLISEHYYVWWGFEDDKLYDFAKYELTRLDKEGKPFNFTMETADTHFPDGYLSVNAEKKHDSQYANVISYSTKEAVEFIRWIQEQPFYENTTIVVTGDHLSMDKNFFKDFDKDYRRSVFNLILNSPITTENVKNREFAPFDFFPTTLASMGVEIEGDRLGLGTNLFSDKKTIIETEGLEETEINLSANSKFFTDTFLNESKTSVFENTLVTEK